jgi:hypothetical protein
MGSRRGCRPSKGIRQSRKSKRLKKITNGNGGPGNQLVHLVFRRWKVLDSGSVKVSRKISLQPKCKFARSIFGSRLRTLGSGRRVNRFSKLLTIFAIGETLERSLISQYSFGFKKRTATVSWKLHHFRICSVTFWKSTKVSNRENCDMYLVNLITLLVCKREQRQDDSLHMKIIMIRQPQRWRSHLYNR